MIEKSYYMEKAIQNKPKLYKKTINSFSFGWPIPDDTKWFQYRFEEREAPENVKTGDSFCVDFGNHYTGYLSFRMSIAEQYPDAPVRVRIKLAESLYELGRDFDSYNGVLSSSWLQEEIINIDEPSVIELPRRYAFRYVKFTIEAMGSDYPVIFSDFELTAVTSADTTKYKTVTSNPELQKIDEIGVHTLVNCMQSVFEDGPKRDRRLWLGDLRLQALTGYYTLQSVNVAKRCMYLFAAHTEPGNRVPRDIFQNSHGTYCEGGWLADYALMFPVCLCDYYEYTGDDEVVDDLFALADEQIQIAWADTDNGIVKKLDDLVEWWAFIDWCDDIKKVTSLQGVLLYALDKMIYLCQRSGRTQKAEEYTDYAKILRSVAKEKLYDSKSGYFVNSYDEYQLSVHSQVWMVLGGVVEGQQAQEIMLRILQDEDAKQPVTPYMHHYVVEALIRAELKEEAYAYINSYWGEMVRSGADTYWEVFVPGDLSVSPYEDSIINSCCHAWSCSVSYFIRKYWCES